MILSIFFQLENASLYCTLLFVYRGTYAVSFPAYNITARDFILLRLFNFNHSNPELVRTDNMYFLYVTDLRIKALQSL